MPKPICVCMIFSCQGVSADVMDGSDVYQHTHNSPAEHLRPTFACGPDLKHRRGKKKSVTRLCEGKNREPPSGSVWPRQTVTSPSHVHCPIHSERKREREKKEPA